MCGIAAGRSLEYYRFYDPNANARNTKAILFSFFFVGVCEVLFRHIDPNYVYSSS